MTEPPRRVSVTGPRRIRARPRPGTGPREAGRDPDPVEDLLLRSLMRAQLSLALRVGGAFALLLGGLPLLFALVPASRRLPVLGVPLPWLVLGLLIYPLIVAGGWFYVRRAERTEREFVDLVDRS